MNLSTLTISQVTEAVNTYNSIYGEMDEALWCLARYCRNALLEERDIEVIETLIWTIKSWWGVQGVTTETKTLMARALVQMKWSAELFEQKIEVSENAASFAHKRVSDLVAKLPRREYSLASKSLHWLLPWRVPAYDRAVRQGLGLSADPTDPSSTYHVAVRKLFRLVRRFETEDPSWLGKVEPKSPLRALDKCVWWLGSGKKGTAALVRDPWKVVYQLGLDYNAL